MKRMLVLVLPAALAACHADDAGTSPTPARPAAPAPAAPAATEVAPRDLTFPALATPGTNPAGRLEVGAFAQGTLGTHDHAMTGGGLADDYALALTAGHPVTVVTRGGPSETTPGALLDVHTALLRDGRVVAHDDDSAAGDGAADSRIVYTPEATDTYVVRVTTSGSGRHAGNYLVQTYDGALPSQR